MVLLDRARKRVVAAIVSAPDFPWRRVDDLDRRDRDSCALALLESAGWIRIWELPSGPRVTLTPWAANRLKLELVEFVEGKARWAKRGTAVPPLKADRQSGIGSWPLAEVVAPPAPEPEEAESEPMGTLRSEPGSRHALDSAGQPVRILGAPVQLDLPQSRWKRKETVRP